VRDSELREKREKRMKDIKSLNLDYRLSKFDSDDFLVRFYLWLNYRLLEPLSLATEGLAKKMPTIVIIIYNFKHNL
jgi:hypothetical protein